MVDEVLRSESNTLTWSKVEKAAEKAFSGFTEPGVELGALDWAYQAWDALIQTGLATYSTETERSQVIIRFLALAGFYLEFCSVAWKENAKANYYFWADELDFIHYYAICYYAKDLVGSDSGWEAFEDNAYELDDAALQKLAEIARKEVLSALLDEFGSISALFISLWQSNTPKISGDDEPNNCYQTENKALGENLTLQNLTTLNWLAQQCSDKLSKEEDFELKFIFNQGTQETNMNDMKNNTVEPQSACLFSNNTFDILEQLKEKSTGDFYLSHEEQFKKYVEKPFQELLLEIAFQLPDVIVNQLEIGKAEFAYWDRYQAFLYPQKLHPTKSVTLYISLYSKYLSFGLIIPNDSINMTRLIINSRNYSKATQIAIQTFPENCNFVKTGGGHDTINKLEPWLKDIAQENSEKKKLQVSSKLLKQKVLDYSKEQIVEQIAQVFKKLFPLFLLAISHEPILAIEEYLDSLHHLNYFEPLFTEICQNVYSKGLRISESILRRYHLALRSRKFVILSGISGAGKTWLTKAYAEAVEAEYLLVPVAPNWTTNEDLLGYLSPIDNKYHDTDFSTFLEKAEEEYKQTQAEKCTPRPYHLVLDEMNLARVEYYFAKFLSAMEVRMREGVAQIQLAPEKHVLLPPNLYFIGTVNVDETTHSFADKVYDRAQLIELEAPRQDLYEHLGEVPYREMLMQIWDEVHVVAPFAFRVLDEIKTYVKEAEALEVSWQDALDEQLLQKILPKLKGGDDRVGVVLKAFVDIVNDSDFPLSHKKATKMLDTFNQHGFTSYF